MIIFPKTFIMEQATAQMENCVNFVSCHVDVAITNKVHF